VQGVDTLGGEAPLNFVHHRAFVDIVKKWPHSVSISSECDQNVSA